MKKKLNTLYQQLQARGLTVRQERIIQHELELLEVASSRHVLEQQSDQAPGRGRTVVDDDFFRFQDFQPPQMAAFLTGNTIEDLLERDKQREHDGFPRKIQVGKMIKPGQDGDDKVVVIPTTVEEKFLHDQVQEQEEEESSDGDGEDEGEGAGGAGEGVKRETSLGSSPYVKKKAEKEVRAREKVVAMKSNPTSMTLAKF